MVEREFLALNSLFDSIGLIEKGIEKVYHYLLQHQKIDNLKEVSTQFNLTLKRGYKITTFSRKKRERGKRVKRIHKKL